MTPETTLQGRFGPAYVKKAFSLRDSYGGVSIRYALDRKVLNIPIVLQFGPQSDPERDLLDFALWTAKER